MRILLTIFLTTISITAFAECDSYKFELEKVKTTMDGEFYLRGICEEHDVRVAIFPGHRCCITKLNNGESEACEVVFEYENENTITHQYLSEKYLVTVGTSKEHPWDRSARCLKLKQSSPNNIQKDVQK